MGIIEETAKTNKGIDNFESANDKVKFEVYELTLKELFKTLKDPTHEYLETVGECLATLEDGFYTLMNNDAIQDVDLDEILLIFIDARSYSRSALSKEVGSQEYFENQGLCRRKINEIIQQLR